MTDIDLTTVPLASLTAEIKRRMQEFENAKKELGFAEAAIPARVGRPRKSGQPQETGGKNPTMSNAAFGRWSGWKVYKRNHPNATTQDYFKARKGGKA